MPITPADRTRLNNNIAAGLVPSWGEPVAGQTSLAGAVCLALRLPWEQQPAIIADPDYVFVTRLHDAFLGTPAERAALFGALAFAWLETAGADRSTWVGLVVRGAVERVTPIAFRAGVARDPLRAAELEAAATLCEGAVTETSARAAKLAALGIEDLESTAGAAAKAFWRGTNLYGGAKDAAKAACSPIDRNAAIRALVTVAIDAYTAEGRS